MNKLSDFDKAYKSLEATEITNQQMSNVLGGGCTSCSRNCTTKKKTTTIHCVVVKRWGAGSGSQQLPADSVGGEQYRPGDSGVMAPLGSGVPITRVG